MGGGGAPVAGFTPTFNPADLTAAETAVVQGIKNLPQNIQSGPFGLTNAPQNMGGTNIPDFNFLSSMLMGTAGPGGVAGDPFGGQGVSNIPQTIPFDPALDAALSGGNMLMQAGQNTFSTGQGINQVGLDVANLGRSLDPFTQQQFAAGQQVWQQAQDPFNDLYNRYLALTTQQQNVQNAMSGVQSTPYGASLADQNLQNFNLGWRQQLLGNQIAGLQALGQSNQVGTGMTQADAAMQGMGSQLQGFGMNLETAAGPMIATGGSMPLDFYNQAIQNAMGGLGGGQQFGLQAIQGATQIPQLQLGDYFTMLGQVQPALVGAQNQTALAANTIQATKFQEIAQAFGGIGSLFGGFGGGGGGGGFGMV